MKLHGGEHGCGPLKSCFFWGAWVTCCSSCLGAQEHDEGDACDHGWDAPDLVLEHLREMSALEEYCNDPEVHHLIFEVEQHGFKAISGCALAVVRLPFGLPPQRCDDLLRSVCALWWDFHPTWLG